MVPGTLDLVVRGGLLIDGTGSPPVPADVAVAGDRIVAVGDITRDVDADAVRVLDADGRVVAPGFIDVHTHLDAQAFWDATLSPSPLHGITSVFAGNCGFTI